MSVIIMCCRACSISELENLKNQAQTSRIAESFETQIELLTNSLNFCPECNQIGCPRSENHQNPCSGKPQ